MERQFNNGDFEKLLRDNANQYRMYPSEKVWKGIHSALHTRRRWYGITAAFMFLITGSIVSIIIYNPETNNELAQQKATAVNNNTQSSVSSSPITRSFTPATTSVKASPKRISSVNFNDFYLNNSATNTSPIVTEEENKTPYNITDADKIQVVEVNVDDNPILTEPVIIEFDLVKINSNIEKKETGDNSIVLTERPVTDESALNSEMEKKINEMISAIASQNIPVTKTNKQSKVTAQVYFTPTVSYRKLTENKKVQNGFYSPVFDLNNVVKHKPAMGLEFGIEGRYHVTDNFSLKSGLQFNINRYDIRAYSHPTEIATVALSSGYGIDSMATLSNYRNFSGNTPNWLENFYFQAAIPVGVEFILSDKKEFQWGVSGTIQPTYVIGDRAYVISSDYKNYAKFPDLMRRWNLSTGVGTFVTYSTGRIKWQAGPHLRYQHMSSFVSELTIKEKLFSVGLKVGATLNNKK